MNKKNSGLPPPPPSLVHSFSLITNLYVSNSNTLKIHASKSKTAIEEKLFLTFDLVWINSKI